MDTKVLIADAKARFSHNLAKAYLKEKYNNKLVVALQGGLWRADANTIGLLSTLTQPIVVLIDTFDNPVEVDRKSLLDSLTEVYNTTMQEWHKEWKELEGKR